MRPTQGSVLQPAPVASLPLGLALLLALLLSVALPASARADEAAVVNVTQQGYALWTNLSPVWIDNDRALLYLSRFSHHDSSLWKIAPGGGTAEQLTFHTCWTGQFDWHQGRRSVSYVARLTDTDLVEDENYEIYRLDLETGENKRLTYHPGWDGMPDWSPDGSWVAYQSCQGGDAAIWLMDRDGRQQRRLSETKGWAGNPRWSPDGAWIAYESAHSGGYDLWIIRPDGSGARNLTADAAWDGNAVWLPDGSGLVYESDRSGNYDLWRIDLNGALSRLTDSPGWDGMPAISPEGERIAYHSAQQGTFVIRVLDLKTRRDAVWFRQPKSFAFNPQWSADGSKLVFECAADLIWKAVPSRINEGETLGELPERASATSATAVSVSPAAWEALRTLPYSPYAYETVVDRRQQVPGLDFDSPPGYFKPGGMLSGLTAVARGIAVNGDPVLQRNLINGARLVLERVRRVKESAIWVYEKDSHLGPGEWYSAYAQGYGIGVALAAHALTKEPAFLELAQAALNPYQIETTEGGVKRKKGDGAWYEEYASPTLPENYVLNGHLYALYGALDLWRATQSPEAKEVFDAGIRGLRALLPRFDGGTFSFYDLYPRGPGFPLGIGRPALSHYNRVVYRQLLFLSRLTHDSSLLARALRFVAYNRAPDPSFGIVASNTVDVPAHGTSWLSDGKVRVGPEYWSARLPVVLSADLGSVRWVHGVEFYGNSKGLPRTFVVKVSRDGRSWTPALQVSDHIQPLVHDAHFFPRPLQARFLRIEVSQSQGQLLVLTEVAAITRVRAAARDTRSLPGPRGGKQLLPRLSVRNAPATDWTLYYPAKSGLSPLPSPIALKLPATLEIELGAESRISELTLEVQTGRLEQGLTVGARYEPGAYSPVKARVDLAQDGRQARLVFPEPVRASQLEIRLPPQDQKLTLSAVEVTALRGEVVGESFHERAIEGKAGRFQCADLPTFLDLCLDAPRLLPAVRFETGESKTSASGVAAEVAVQVSSDGLDWETVGVVDRLGPSALLKVGRSCRMVRLVVLRTANGEPLVVREIAPVTQP